MVQESRAPTGSTLVLLLCVCPLFWHSTGVFAYHVAISDWIISPQNFHFQILAPCASECDVIWKKVITGLISSDDITLEQHRPLGPIQIVSLEKAGIWMLTCTARNEVRKQGDVSTNQRPPKTASKAPEARGQNGEQPSAEPSQPTPGSGTSYLQNSDDTFLLFKPNPMKPNPTKQNWSTLPIDKKILSMSQRLQ